MPIRNLLLRFAVICIMGWPFTVLMPVFAAQVLHGGPHTLGFLMGALGLGAFAGSVSLTLRRSVRGLVGTLFVADLSVGVLLILIGLSHWQWASLGLMLLVGFALLRCTVGTNTIIQTVMEEKMRGRVLGYYMMVLEGLGPWGSLIAGALAQRWGAPNAVMISGVVCILGALWFWTQMGKVRKSMRPIYVELGIVPAAEEVEN